MSANPLPTACPTVSIVLLTHNGLPDFERCLSMIFRQTIDAKVEIVHIDSGSTDGTLDVTSAFSLQTQHIRSSDFHHSRTRNYAVTLAHNDIVVFLTQDSIPKNTNWLSSLIAPFLDPMVGGVYGRQIPASGVGPVRRCAMEYIYPAQREVRDPAGLQHFRLSMVRFSNANSAIRKQLLNRLRFDEHALVCEDHGMCRDILRSGYKIVYEPEAIVVHGHERSLYSEFQWAVDNGISLTRMGILGQKNSAESELRYGFASVVHQMRYFYRQREYWLALVSISTNAVRWLGAQLGKREKLVPLWILRKVSPGLRRVSM
jgi:rhamnosyltransferase